MLGIPRPSPSEAGGTNYAWGGAPTGVGTYAIEGTSFTVPRIGSQIAEYLEETGNDVVGRALHIILAGHSDFVLLGVPEPDMIVSEISSYVTSIAKAGGTRFLVSNLPPMGHFPEITEDQEKQRLNDLSDTFSQLLSQELDTLEAELEVNIIDFDLLGIQNAVIAAPDDYGFSNVITPAFDGNDVLGDLSTSLYMDESHYTGAFHLLVGKQAALAFESVPEPTISAWTLVVPLVLLSRRRSAAREY